MKNIEYLYRYYDFYFLHEERFSISSYLDVDALCKLPNVAQNLLVIYERSKKLVEYKKKARLRELSDYRFYS
jgi:hypothetical protein